jgi:TonB family protein
MNVLPYPRGFAARTPLHALSRAASPARSVRVARSLYSLAVNGDFVPRTASLSSCMLCLLSLLTFAIPAQAQNGSDVDRVRSLYVAAAYEEALAAMPANATGAARRDLEQYRALCLLALGREPEAVDAIERIVKDNPTYQPAESDTSPRMRGMFAEVRSKLIPDIARETYAEAKKSFDAKDVDGALNGFKRTIEVIDSLPESDKEALADLRMLVTGFTDLLGAQPSPKPESVPSLPPNLDAAAEYVGPVPIREQLPPWNPPDTAARLREYVGLLRIDIGEDGQVRNAVMVETTHPLYDSAAVRAAKSWTYKPATRGGKPVTAQKDIKVRLVPR